MHLIPKEQLGLATTFAAFLATLRQNPSLNDSFEERLCRLTKDSKTAKGVSHKTSRNKGLFKVVLSKIPPKAKTTGLQQLATLAWSKPVAALSCSGPFLRPLSALRLVEPLAQKIALKDNINLPQARYRVLNNLGLDLHIDWQNADLKAICAANCVLDTLHGLSFISDPLTLVGALSFGLGAADQYAGLTSQKSSADVIHQARRVALKLASEPDAWLTETVMSGRSALGDLEIVYRQNSN
ncbi:MAG: hypothetical protein IPP97_10685 [Candidatus Obscuribacter sp.]|nr:hypothetical protein [Candidatus Obscuribacter sp.]MBP6351607.1 hypothetical protein [Candidatus Obscuribacter sp.]MBP6593135.1 hypothetical protein [Candidatus Obscuribacter sp.]